jgi:hypothetical protein
MAHRMRGQNLDISGTTTFNGSHTLSSIRHAYVMQQDVLLPTLTVRETLQYSAELRLPSGTSVEERERVIEEVILQLGLKECANTPIGDSVHKGCSGGEKRRVSIGVQLLSNPSVLFLDGMCVIALVESRLMENRANDGPRCYICLPACPDAEKPGQKGKNNYNNVAPTPFRDLGAFRSNYSGGTRKLSFQRQGVSC